MEINLTKFNKVTAWIPPFLGFGMSLWLPVCCLLLFRARLLDRQPLEGIAAVHGPRRERQLRAEEAVTTGTPSAEGLFCTAPEENLHPNSLSISPLKTLTISCMFTVYIARSRLSMWLKHPRVLQGGGEHPPWGKKDSWGDTSIPSTSHTVLRPSPYVASQVSNSGMFK